MRKEYTNRETANFGGAAIEFCHNSDMALAKPRKHCREAYTKHYL